MFDDLEDEQVVLRVRREYENLGCRDNVNVVDEKSPFIRDHHGFLRDSEDFNKLYENGPVDHGAAASYGEALKAIEYKTNDDALAVNNSVLAFYTCTHCELVFKHPKRFLIHYKWHSHGKPYNVADLEAPRRRPKKSKTPEPDDCDAPGDNIKTETKDGEKKEDDEGNNSFECDICKQVYRTRKSMQNHRTRLHFAKPRQCHICNKTFLNGGYLHTHMLSHNEDNKFMCSQCPKTFKFMHSLQRHMPTHLEEKNFPCQACDKSFGSDLLLKIHFRTHMKPLQGKSLKCGYCPKTFYQGFSLVAHERTHTGEKPFECHMCKQRYPTNSSLTRHLKVSHSHNLPYECEYCNKTFHIRSAWDFHIKRAHLKERPFQCTFCESKFICRSELQKHTAKHHQTPDDSMLVGHQIDETPPPKPPSAVKRKRLRRKKKKDYSDDSS